MSAAKVVAWFNPANPNSVISAAQYPHVLPKNKVGYLPCIVAPSSGHEPYLCIEPACAGDCCGCNCAISPADMRKYAVRYALLLRRDPSLNETTDRDLALMADSEGEQ